MGNKSAQRVEKALKNAQKQIDKAERLAAEVPDGQAKKLSARIASVRDETDVSAKKVAKKPKKVARKVEAATDELRARITKAKTKIPSRSATPEPAEDPRTVVELRAIAKKQGRTGYSRLRKADLVTLVSSGD